MDGVLQVAVLLVGLGTAAAGAPTDSGMLANGPPTVALACAENLSCRDTCIARALPRAHAAQDVQHTARVEPVQVRPDSWTGEDKFRHAAASWAAMVFTYAGTRALYDDADAAMAVAVPVTAAFGIAKEVVDRRGGGPFSFRDLAADALGAGAAWLFLREMR